MVSDDPKSATEGASVAIRDAATVILIRDATTNPAVLMGQRGRDAVFMPDKFVFPGGAIDDGDKDVRLAATVSDICRSRLAAHNTGSSPEAIAAAAIRELWEETGLRLANTGEWSAPNQSWTGFQSQPSAQALKFFFRAVTPEGRPRRFDARFFLAPAEALLDHPDDHPQSSDELSHLSWVPLTEVRKLDLAFITEIVLAQLTEHLPRMDPPDAVPFIRNDRLDNKVIWL